MASKNRSIKLLRSDLSSALERCSEMENRVGAVEAGSVEVEERRKELEENENTGDEKINLLEEEVKEVRKIKKVAFPIKG